MWYNVGMNKCIDCGKEIASRSKRCTACHCGRLNKSKIGVPMKESTTEKLRIINTGRKMTDEAKKKMSDAKIGKTSHMLGKKHSKKTRMKISKSNMGRIPWNKGIPWSDEVIEKFSRARKGKHFSPETEFKKGRVAENKGVFGDTVNSAHNWVKAKVKRPKCCEFCGSTEHLEWSNKSHKYKKERNDWQYLCRKCHMRYDFETHNCRTSL